MAGVDDAVKAAALIGAAQALRDRMPDILSANAQDVDAAVAAGISPAMLDRLKLDAARVAAMASAVEQVATLDDPVGKIIDRSERPNGLLMERVRVPVGVLGIIYESRPNVTADAAALGLRSGNAVILRGGSEAVHSNRAIHAAAIQYYTRLRRI
jgi:glutamate-5-semialdehyde dehydrogenase